MSEQGESGTMALFCDFENVAIGVRDANYALFDIRLVLEKLLLKGSIIVKKAYSDWSRYKDFKAGMHEASFELIDVPHVRQSGKNSADIRMVVDALDLCYTKPHVQTFVIISGDSDFSPLVSKLRENNKTVIGVGVKNSASDLLIANCDEFIYYDDLVRARKPARAPRASTPRASSRRTSAREKGAEKPVEKAAETSTETPAETPVEATVAKRPDEGTDDHRLEGLRLVVETAEGLMTERGSDEPLWGSMVKQTLRRRRPGFNESYYGYRSFNSLLEDARDRGMLRLKRDEKSGGYLISGLKMEDGE